MGPILRTGLSKIIASLFLVPSSWNCLWKSCSINVHNVQFAELQRTCRNKPLENRLSCPVSISCFFFVWLLVSLVKTTPLTKCFLLLWVPVSHQSCRDSHGLLSRMVGFACGRCPVIICQAEVFAMLFVCKVSCICGKQKLLKAFEGQNCVWCYLAMYLTHLRGLHPCFCLSPPDKPNRFPWRRCQPRALNSMAVLTGSEFAAYLLSFPTADHLFPSAEGFGESHSEG